MRYAAFTSDRGRGLAVVAPDGLRGYVEIDSDYPGSLLELLTEGAGHLADAGKALLRAPRLDSNAIEYRPPIEAPEKVICVGLNYVDHSAESGFKTPTYPTLFGRFNSSMIAHGQPMIRPNASEQLDYEGELVAIVGKICKNVDESEALNYVAGYSIFNDGSIRDYQFKAPQWTPGKNFDGTGAFGPYFVTADELPAGCKGLKLETRLNGRVVQSAMIDDMVFSVAALVSIISKVMTLSPGDLIVTGTPSGVGLARKPPLFMKDGDICEVEIDRLGVLRSPVKNEMAGAEPA